MLHLPGLKTAKNKGFSRNDFFNSSKSLLMTYYLHAVKNILGPIAQSVEQRTFNPWVLGSIPSGPTGTSNDRLRLAKCPFCPFIATILGLIRSGE